MRCIADLHIHSRYSRATSGEMGVETIASWAAKKGITVVGTGDFTHPTYFSELKAKLTPSGPGIFSLRKKGGADAARVHFVLSSEVSTVFTQGGRVRKIHLCLLTPGFDDAGKIILSLGKVGKLSSDGRPTFGMSARELMKRILDVSPRSVVIPAHAWTPWFSLFGANSGFDSIEECFGDDARHIFAIETGLSSDPEMNWRLSSLDGIALVSNSDAHSPSKLGREATVFDCAPDFAEMMNALREKDPRKFLYTIEFFPQEGKYHYDGHRSCSMMMSPEETRKAGGLCPACGKKITVGVMNRIDALADRSSGHVPPGAIPTRHLIPLEEIIAESLGVHVGTKRVMNEYEKIVTQGGSEFSVLLDISYNDLSRIASPRIVEGIKRVREGKVRIAPGYDGVYGRIEIFGAAADELPPSRSPSQMKLF